MPVVSVTPAAAELIRSLRGRHGPLMFHQSGGCCDGSAPMCYPAGEFRTGSSDVLLASLSGGTDVCTAFVGSTPLLPVRAGEITCSLLGIAAAAFDADGNVCAPEVQGELVITEPMPSMPVGFWGDDDGSKLRAAYFSDYPGIWRHGDWITFSDDGASVLSGRSDATLNRGGVRLGTSDFYTVVEELPEIADSLVVHMDDDPDDSIVSTHVEAMLVKQPGGWATARPEKE